MSWGPTEFEADDATANAIYNVAKELSRVADNLAGLSYHPSTEGLSIAEAVDLVSKAISELAVARDD